MYDSLQKTGLRRAVGSNTACCHMFCAQTHHLCAAGVAAITTGIIGSETLIQSILGVKDFACGRRADSYILLQRTVAYVV